MVFILLLKGPGHRARRSTRQRVFNRLWIGASEEVRCPVRSPVDRGDGVSRPVTRAPPPRICWTCSSVSPRSPDTPCCPSPGTCRGSTSRAAAAPPRRRLIMVSTARRVNARPVSPVASRRTARATGGVRPAQTASRRASEPRRLHRKRQAASCAPEDLVAQGEAPLAAVRRSHPAARPLGAPRAGAARQRQDPHRSPDDMVTSCFHYTRGRAGGPPVMTELRRIPRGSGAAQALGRDHAQQIGRARVTQDN